MAAAAAALPTTIDFKSQATFPIRLGASISRSSDTARFAGIRYNHKPRLSPSCRATIKRGDDAGESRLLLDNDDGQYEYSGSYGAERESYVLVCRGQGKDKEMVLERLDSSHSYNLTRTPSESSAAKLAGRYPLLPIDDENEDDLFGSDDIEAPADDSNPFDYRHFLKAELERPESTNANIDATRSSAGTPLVRAQGSDTPASKPVNRAESKSKVVNSKKRKATATPKDNPKRVKAGHEPPAASTSASSTKTVRQKPDVPKINLDRKASLRRPSLDSGELILENETPISEKPPKHPSSMALALSGHLGGGPISLRSAANSPGSHVASPAPERPADTEGEYVFEFDEDEPEPAEDHELAEADADADREQDDEDVDALELPSPAQASRPSVDPPTNPGGGGDDDDDLDKQLALAMMEEDDGGNNQESEESEEE